MLLSTHLFNALLGAISRIADDINFSVLTLENFLRGVTEMYAFVLFRMLHKHCIFRKHIVSAKFEAKQTHGFPYCGIKNFRRDCKKRYS